MLLSDLGDVLAALQGLAFTNELTLNLLQKFLKVLFVQPERDLLQVDLDVTLDFVPFFLMLSNFAANRNFALLLYKNRCKTDL